MQPRTPSMRNQQRAQGRDDLTDNAERGQDHNVNLGVTEEPENVLEQDRITATSCVEKTFEVDVHQHHSNHTSQHGHHRD